MSVSSVSNEVQKSWFDLNENQLPVNCEQFKAGLEALANLEVSWVGRHDLTRYAWKKISFLDKDKLDTEIQRVYQVVFEKWIEVSLGQDVAYLRKSDLAKLSKMFAALAREKWEESETGKFNLKLAEGVSAEAGHQFFAYLQTGQISEWGEVFDIYRQASLYQVTPLLAESRRCIGQSLTKEILLDTMKFAREFKDQDLLLLCFDFALQNKIQYYRSDLQELDEVIRNILILADGFVHSKMKLLISENFGNVVICEGNTRWEVKKNEIDCDLLKKFHFLFKIGLLDISWFALGTQENMQTLRGISHTLPTLEELIIDHCSNNWFGGIRQLFPMLRGVGNTNFSCFNPRNAKNTLDRFATSESEQSPLGKPFLRSMNLYYASLKPSSSVDPTDYVKYFPFLYSFELSALNDDSVRGGRNPFKGLEEYKDVVLPMAHRVDVGHCDGLNSILAPQAKFLKCRDMPDLTAVSAPRATTIFIENCPKITTVVALSGDRLHFENCPNLSSVTIGDSEPSSFKNINCQKLNAGTDLTRMEALGRKIEAVDRKLNTGMPLIMNLLVLLYLVYIIITYVRTLFGKTPTAPSQPNRLG